MFDLILSIVVICSVILLAGALYLWRKQGNVKQASLMALLAFVMIANTVIWTAPDENGASLSTGAVSE